MDVYETMVQLGAEIAEIEASMSAIAQARRRPTGDTSQPPTAKDRLELTAFHNAATLISAAVDHLRTVAQIASSRVIPAFALMSLIRTSYECSLLAQWLMDDVSSRERLTRGVRVQYADLVERNKFEKAIERGTPPSGKLAVDRIADLLTEAASVGVVVQRDDGTIVPPANPPSVTELFDTYESRDRTEERSGLKGQAYYRLLSGYAHGKQWAMTLGFQPVGTPDTHGNSVGVITGNDDQTLGLMDRATRRLRNASTAYLGLCK